MAGLADIMLQGQIQATDPQKGPDLAGSYAKGAELAQHAEQIQQQAKQLEQHQQEIESAKISKVMDAVEKAQQYSGKAQAQYITKVLPGYVKALGMEKKFPLDNLQFATANDDNLARIGVIKGKVQRGEWTSEQGIRIMLDPIEMAKIDLPTLSDKAAQASPADVEEILNREKGYLGNQAQMAKTVYTQQATDQRAAADDARAGSVELAKKVAIDYEKFQGEGGMSAAQAKLKKLDEAIDKLKSGKVKTGGISGMIPGLNGASGQRVLNPDAKALMDDIHGAVNLKQQLDSQFSDRAMDQVLSRSFDIGLPSNVNIKKIENVRNELANDLKNKAKLFKSQGHDIGEVPDSGKNDIPEMVTTPKGASISLSKAKDIAKAHPERLPDMAAQLGYTEAELRQLLGLKSKGK